MVLTGLLADTAVLIIEVEERPVWDGDHWLRPAVVDYLAEHGLVPVARDLSLGSNTTSCSSEPTSSNVRRSPPGSIDGRPTSEGWHHA